MHIWRLTVTDINGDLLSVMGDEGYFRGIVDQWHAWQRQTQCGEVGQTQFGEVDSLPAYPVSVCGHAEDFARSPVEFVVPSGAVVRMQLERVHAVVQAPRSSTSIATGN
jgi:hypothetical protein